MSAISWPISHRVRGEPVRSVESLLAGLGVLAILLATGSVAAERDLLVFVGFDPDRAILLTAFTAGGVSAFAGGMLTGQRRIPSILGVIAVAAIFGSTFRHETQVAIRARGDQGSFDPLGWGLTLLTLVVTGLVIGWALATIGDSVRSSLLLTWSRTRHTVASRGLPGRSTGGSRRRSRSRQS